MPSIGETLRQARETRDTTIEEVAAATGIGLTYLQAMEEDAYDALPGRAFGKLYLRAYGEVLGFDPQPLIHHYDRERPRDAEVVLEKRSLAEEPRRVEAAIAKWRESRIAALHGGREIVVDPEPTPVEPVIYEDDPAAAIPVLAPEPEAAEESLIPTELAVPEPVPVNNLAATVEPVVYEEAVVVPEGAEESLIPTELAVPEPEPVNNLAATVEPLPVAPNRFRLRAALGAVVAVAAALVLFVVWQSAPTPAPAVVTAPVVVTAPPVVDPPPAALPQPPAPKPRPVPPAAALPPSDLRVDEFGAGRRLVDRRVPEPEDRFTEGDVVWFSTRIEGGRRGERIRHVWLHEGRAVQSIRLPLGGADWRTYSSKTLWGAGAWSVEARDDAGRVLARSTFDCVKR